MQDNRAFQQMLLSAKERIRVHTPKEIAQKSGVVFHEDKSFFELQSLIRGFELPFRSIDSNRRLTSGSNW